MAKETKVSIALHVVAMIILAAFMWALADYKAALISLLVYVAMAAIREMGEQDGQREMREKCLENFIEGAAKVVEDTDAAMKALCIDEETQQNIRKAREIVHKARCGGFPVPDKITIRKETEPQPPSFEESQGESGTNVADK